MFSVYIFGSQIKKFLSLQLASLHLNLDKRFKFAPRLLFQKQTQFSVEFLPPSGWLTPQLSNSNLRPVAIHLKEVSEAFLRPEVQIPTCNFPDLSESKKSPIQKKLIYLLNF